MNGGKHRVLVAEDNSALASVVRFNLQRAGLEVEVAANGRIAWEMAQDAEFDMVVTDQQMPEMNGCELCELLRQSPQYRQTPIIMLTAKGMELELERLRTELNISATYLKPFSPSEIVQAVRDCLALAT